MATTALKFSNVGNYPITVTLGLNPNYSVTPTDGTLHIDQKNASVTASDKTKAYLAANPTLTAIVTGTVNGDTLNYTLSTKATQTSFPGTYPITVTLGSNPNYTVSPTNAQLTVGYGTCTGPDPGGVILPPINNDGSSVYKRKGGSTIPVKSKVCDANGNAISNPYAVFLNYPQGGQLTMTGQIRGTIEQVNETSETTISDVAFTFTGGQWHFNMDTGNLTAGNTYTFRINLATGPGITFTVGVK